MKTDFSNITGMFKTSTDIVSKAIGEISPDRWFDKPGSDSNHLMWVLGHLVWARGNILKILNEPVDTPSPSLFARGAKQSEQGEYPSAEEMKNAWNEVSAKLSTVLAEPSTEILSKSAPEGGAPSFDGKVSGVLAFLAFHESYHVGQVSYLKKWLGYGQTVG